MIIGHFFLAFSIAGILSAYLQMDRDKALIFCISAALFSVLPDIDMIYGLKAILTVLKPEYTELITGFWNVSNQVHRGITHSIITSIFAVIGFSTYHKTGENIIAAMLILLSGLSGLIFSGFIGGFIMILFCFLGLLLAEKTRRILKSMEFVYASAIGLILHPFGDLFTGKPPDLLFPLKATIFENRIVILEDPALNLIFIFLLEVSLGLTGLYTFVRLKEIPFKDNTRFMPLSGLLFGLSAFHLQPPSLQVSYQFVYSVIGFSIFMNFIDFSYRQKVTRPDKEEIIHFTLNTGLTAVVSIISYLIIYLII